MSFYFANYFEARRWAKAHCKAKYRLTLRELHLFGRFAMAWIRGKFTTNDDCITRLSAIEWELMLVNQVLPITRGDEPQRPWPKPLYRRKVIEMKVHEIKMKIRDILEAYIGSMNPIWEPNYLDDSTIGDVLIDALTELVLKEKEEED